MYIVEPKVINELEDNKAIGFPDIIEKYKQNGEKIGYIQLVRIVGLIWGS